MTRTCSFLLAGALTVLMAAPASAQTITVTDQEGREINLDGPAQRIVTIPMPMASGVIAIDGSADKLAGMNPLSLTAIEEGVLGRIFPEALSITDAVTATNFVPNVEALAAANPDLVIQWGGRGPEIVDPIVNAGLNALLIVYGNESNTRDYMANVATAIGKSERNDAHVLWREEVAQSITATLADLDDEVRPNVLYMGRSLSDITASGAGNSFQNWSIELAGGKNAAAELEGNQSINREQIAQWNPDIILLNSFEPDLDVSWVYDDPILSLTTAAQEKKVYKMPLGGYRWDPPSQESPLTWMWMAELFHPELFDFDLRAEMTDAYQVLYDYELTQADLDEILWVSDQGDGAGYDQFLAR